MVRTPLSLLTWIALCSCQGSIDDEMGYHSEASPSRKTTPPLKSPFYGGPKVYRMVYESALVAGVYKRGCRNPLQE